jgi:hypothetical protein
MKLDTVNLRSGLLFFLSYVVPDFEPSETADPAFEIRLLYRVVPLLRLPLAPSPVVSLDWEYRGAPCETKLGV